MACAVSTAQAMVANDVLVSLRVLFTAAVLKRSRVRDNKRVLFLDNKYIQG
jgi:hypothetical protein